MAARLNKRDLICGGGIFAIGLFGLSTGLSLDIGSMRRIGPGVFPALVGFALTLCGVAIVLIEAREPAGEEQPVNLRGAVLVLAGLGAFAMLIKPAGMVPAVFATVLLSSYAAPDARLRDALGVSAFMSILAYVIFIYGLGFQARAFGPY